MAETEKPWESAFRRVRAIYSPEYRYPPRETVAELDAAEEKLSFKFPVSYRAFAQEFGLDGELHGGLPNVLPLTLRESETEDEWWRSVVSASHFFRTYEWRCDAESLTFLRRVVVFAIDSGYHYWVFDPLDVTNADFGEYRIYDVNRSMDATPIATSFGEWLLWIDEHYRFEREEEEDPKEPEFPPVFKPDSVHPNPMYYARHSLPPPKKAPEQSDIPLLLSFSNHTVRDLARSIRNEGRTEAFPILADALQEAGCTNADLLDSCRTGDPDIDGAWVLQVLLGKA
ncbi:SMI1/KNR4 family protein [Gemmata sp. G18]|uniref:SMI1/KNR4 family protein n=1 Tax=Gemmata palustris TaxID=2822762 RepID=A0ABS5C134_9BACT|nr:SMI1/KNR4 family protein [Gemmata palustris]MBP3959699.1 SMI1/KNR4 family protein [Gemmata palustris]